MCASHWTGRKPKRIYSQVCYWVPVEFQHIIWLFDKKVVKLCLHYSGTENAELHLCHVEPPALFVHWLDFAAQHRHCHCSLWNSILRVVKIANRISWSQVCVLLPKTPSCMPALLFCGEQPKIRLASLSAKTTLCGFPVLILVLEGSREQHTEVAVWAQECFKDGINQFPWLY